MTEQTIRLVADIASVRAAAEGLRSSVNGVAMRALNNAAFQVRAGLQAHIRSPGTFDRPTPAVVSAVRVQKATRENLRAIVFFGHPDPAFQQRLNALGQLEESGGVATPDTFGRKRISVPLKASTQGGPGGSVPILNRYGGMRKDAMRRLTKRPDVFVGLANGKPGTLGIYQRYEGDIRRTVSGLATRGAGGRFASRSETVRGEKLRLLVALEKRTKYKPKMGFYRTADRLARAALPAAIIASGKSSLDRQARIEAEALAGGGQD